MIPLCIKTHYSLLESIITPKDLVDFCIKNEIGTFALTDYSSINGYPETLKLCQKSGIKCIAGTELYICKDYTDKDNSTVILLAKNKQGWKQLLRIITEANRNWKGVPRLSLEDLSNIENNELICIIGHYRSSLIKNLFDEYSVLKDKPDKSNYIEIIDKNLSHYQNLFQNNLYLGYQQIGYPINNVSQKVVDWCSQKRDIKTIFLSDACILNPQDIEKQHILQASYYGKSIYKLSEEELSHNQSFISTQAKKWCPESYLKNLEELVQDFEEFDIFDKPQVPIFDKDIDANSELEILCQAGWQDKFYNKLTSFSREKINTYGDRLKKELGVIQEAGLSNYFLVVRDIIKEAHRQDYYTGPARGSAAGSLASYLLDITNIDPIPYGLIFERFYNKGREGKLPDIDIDIEVAGREKIVNYLRQKYGRENVSNIATYGKLMGRGVIKEVLRALESCTFQVMNQITKPFPESESKIAGEIQAMKDAGEKGSVVMYMLKERAKDVKEYCELKDGKLTGPFAKAFQLAIDLEGTYKSYGKHASGYIISDNPIYEVAPLIHDKNSDELICGFDMHSAEDIGLVKFDLLSLSLLDKEHTCIDLIKERK